jgi:hypothetical protein
MAEPKITNLELLPSYPIFFVIIPAISETTIELLLSSPLKQSSLFVFHSLLLKLTNF